MRIFFFVLSIVSIWVEKNLSFRCESLCYRCIAPIERVYSMWNNLTFSIHLSHCTSAFEVRREWKILYQLHFHPESSFYRFLNFFSHIRRWERENCSCKYLLCIRSSMSIAPIPPSLSIDRNFQSNDEKIILELFHFCFYDETVRWNFDE